MNQIIESKNKLIELFKVLGETQDENKIDDACLGISSVFEQSASSRGYVLVSADMIPYISAGLQHPFYQVRQCTLRQIKLAIDSKVEIIIPWLAQESVLAMIVPLLSMSRLSVANMVMEIFNKLEKEAKKEGAPHSTQLRAILLDQSIHGALKKLLDTSVADKGKDEVVLRVLDVSVSLATVSITSLQTYTNPFIMYLLDRVPKETDTLVKMNLLETVARLGSSSIDALQQVCKHQSFVQDLIDTLNPSLIASHESHSINSAIVLIAKWCTAGNAHTEVVMSAPNLQSALFEALEYHMAHYRDNDTSKRCLETSIGAVGDLGALISGLDRLITRRQLLVEFMESLTASDPIAMCTMHAFATMLTLTTKPTSTSSDKLLQVYECGDGSALERRVMRSITSPIEDIKTAALHLIQSLCLHSWGARVIIHIPGFIEYLLSRTNETTKVMREWKFTIVQTLVQTQEQVLNVHEHKDIWNQLESYHKRGIHYIPSEANLEVATQHL